jgi:hypothetical protein
MIIWLFPPIKNRGTEYFNYFLFLALADPVVLLLRHLFHIPFNVFHLMFGFFLALSFIKDKKTQIIVLILSLLMPVSMYIIKILPIYYALLSAIIQVIIAFVVSMRIVLYLKQSYSLNLFLCLLMFYMSITVIMRIAVLVNLDLGAISFNLGAATQILFGIAFIFININTKNFKLIKEQTENIPGNLPL